ncbi:MAG: hypothetical protein P8Z79_15630, partial [Sedimentisphaerales bacterium]
VRNTGRVLTLPELGITLPGPTKENPARVFLTCLIVHRRNHFGGLNNPRGWRTLYFEAQPVELPALENRPIRRYYHWDRRRF